MKMQSIGSGGWQASTFASTFATARVDRKTPTAAEAMAGRTDRVPEPYPLEAGRGWAWVRPQPSASVRLCPPLSATGDQPGFNRVKPLPACRTEPDKSMGHWLTRD
jgi:hypothetical protein